jgi:hypothetical protein
LFTAVCFVEGAPSRANQEMCARKLWINVADRYAFGVTFHECPNVKLDYPYGSVYRPEGIIVTPDRLRADPQSAPAAYLGRNVAAPEYPPVCVAWVGAESWHAHCGALWWSASSMGLPVAETRTVAGVDSIDLVPIEHLLWVLDPDRLCKPVTGRHWQPIVQPSRNAKGSSMKVSTANREERQLVHLAQSRSVFDAARKVRFERQLALASYVIAQLELYTNMCRGRSYNCVAWLEQAFSYEHLMNLATNPLLPHKCNGAALAFCVALYVDRFPQLPHSGAPCLPERLWVYDDPTSASNHSRDVAIPRASATPVVQPVTLTSDNAFPSFFVPALCSAAKDPNPVLSHPDHYKFFLLRTLCNASLRGFGRSGRVIHGEVDLNDLGMVAVSAQQALLSFGFQSTFSKLKDLCVPNAKLLDGRSDLAHAGKVFDPPDRRYRNSGAASAAVAKLKRNVIKTFEGVEALRTNFRLAQLLALFKQHAAAWACAEGASGGGRPGSPSGLPAYYSTLDGGTPPLQGSSIRPYNESKSKSLKRSFDPGPGSSKFGHTNVSPSASVDAEAARDFLEQASPSAVDALFRDFESLFPGVGGGEGALLDLQALCDKPDIDEAIVDCMMYKIQRTSRRALLPSPFFCVLRTSTTSGVCVCVVQWCFRTL